MSSKILKTGLIGAVFLILIFTVLALIPEPEEVEIPWKQPVELSLEPEINIAQPEPVQDEPVAVTEEPIDQAPSTTILGGSSGGSSGSSGGSSGGSDDQPDDEPAAQEDDPVLTSADFLNNLGSGTHSDVPPPSIPQ